MSCGWDMVVRLLVRGRWSGQRDELFLGLLSLRSKLLQVAPCVMKDTECIRSVRCSDTIRSKLLQVAPAPAPPPTHMSPVLRCL